MVGVFTPTLFRLPAFAQDAIDLPAVELTSVASGLFRPVHITHAGDGSGRLFVVEQAGRIMILDGEQAPRPFLDISDQVESPASGGGNEEGWTNRQTGTNKDGFYPFFLFNGTRVVSFAISGGLLGLLGGVFQFSLEATAVLTILIAALIFIIGMQMLGVPFFQKIPLNLSGRWVSRMINKPALQESFMPILMGAITFFVPCRFTLIAQAGALRSGNFLDGLTILLAFAISTLPVLLFISYSSVKLHQNPRFARSFRVLSGLLIAFFAAYTMISQISMLNPSTLGREDAPSLSASAESISADGPYQLMQMEARGIEYHPEVITITPTCLPGLKSTAKAPSAVPMLSMPEGSTWM